MTRSGLAFVDVNKFSEVRLRSFDMEQSYIGINLTDLISIPDTEREYDHLHEHP